MKKLSLATVMLFMLLSAAQVLSQTVIDYGSATLGTLSSDLPLAVYTFQGTAGDQITLQAISLSADLDLRLTLQNESEDLMLSEGDPFTIGATDTRIDFRLPMTSTYMILVSSPSAQSGDFVVKLFGQPLADKTVQAITSSDIVIDGEIGYYSFSGQSDTTTTVTLSSPSDFEFFALVYDSVGRIIHTAVGTSTVIRVNEAGDFEIALRALDATVQGVITVSIDESRFVLVPTIDDPSSPITVVSPIPRATKYTNPTFDINDACGIFSEGFPNIRTGASTGNAVITQVQPGLAYHVVGRYLNWYQILVPIYGSGWVRGDVVAIGGDCADVPFILPGNTPVLPTPTPTPTQTPTATYTPLPTNTYTPTATATATPTATTTDTLTPSPTVYIPIAPEDASPNSPLNVPLGNLVSVSDFVSYPNGDRDDEVSWDIMGMNANSAEPDGRARLVITATCFGDDTAKIEFTIDDQIYGCGDTLVDEDVTFDSKTGSVAITVIGGEDVYIQWVLTGTATRLD